MNNTPQIALSLAQIEQRFSNCKAWEESYRQLLLLAKQLQAIDAAQHQIDQKAAVQGRIKSVEEQLGRVERLARDA